MRNKTTKKYKNNRKMRGGNVFIDSFTGIFNRTTDTNKEMFEIKQLKTILSKNMQDLTNTYESVYKKVTNLNEKINKLSNISNTNQNTNQENELHNENTNQNTNQENELHNENTNQENNGLFGMFVNKNPESIVSKPYSSNPESIVQESIEPNSYSSTLTPNFENQVAPGQQFTGGKRKSRRKHRVCNR